MSSKEIKKSTLSSAEVRGAVKAAIVDHGDKAKLHFNKDKNYTTKSTIELSKLLESWNKKGLKAPEKKTVELKSIKAKATVVKEADKKKVVAPAKKEAINKVVDTVKRVVVKRVVVKKAEVLPKAIDLNDLDKKASSIASNFSNLRDY